jgi:hypothetical protein
MRNIKIFQKSRFSLIFMYNFKEDKKPGLNLSRQIVFLVIVKMIISTFFSMEKSIIFFLYNVIHSVM